MNNHYFKLNYPEQYLIALQMILQKHLAIPLRKLVIVNILRNSLLKILNKIYMYPLIFIIGTFNCARAMI